MLAPVREQRQRSPPPGPRWPGSGIPPALRTAAAAGTPPADPGLTGLNSPVSRRVTVVIRTSPRSIRAAHSAASGLATRRTRADLSISQVVTSRPGTSRPDRPDQRRRRRTRARSSHADRRTQCRGILSKAPATQPNILRDRPRRAACGIKCRDDLLRHITDQHISHLRLQVLSHDSAMMWAINRIKRRSGSLRHTEADHASFEGSRSSDIYGEVMQRPERLLPAAAAEHGDDHKSGQAIPGPVQKATNGALRARHILASASCSASPTPPSPGTPNARRCTARGRGHVVRRHLGGQRHRGPGQQQGGRAQRLCVGAEENAMTAPLQGAEQANRLAAVIARTGLDTGCTT